MLRELGLRNFKAFGGKEQTAPLSRINLIFGPNSAGKSSILQALLLLKQSLKSEVRPSAGAKSIAGSLELNGEDVKFESASTLHYNRDERREMGIRVRFSQGGLVAFFQTEWGFSLTDVNNDELKSSVLTRVNYQILDESQTLLEIELRRTIEEEIGWKRTIEDEIKLRTFENSWEITNPATVAGHIEHHLTPILDYDEEGPGQFLPSVALPELNVFRKELMDKKREIHGDRCGWTPVTPDYLNDYFNALPLMLNIGKALKCARQTLKPWEYESTKQKQWEEIEEELSRKFAQKGQSQKFRELFSEDQFASLTPENIPDYCMDTFASVTHLGPLRQYPRKSYPNTTKMVNSVGKLGEFTHQLLLDDPERIAVVNYWFNRFEIPYSLGIEQDQASNTSIYLVDSRSNTRVFLPDIGFGVNQLLPVIVEGIGSISKILCVEQPEIHLHPKLQAHLADLMIETCIEEGPWGVEQWIVETHSELLIMRLLKRIREGTIRHEDISILYVDPNDPDVEGSAIEQLQLDEDGIFINGWPNGFFDEDLSELW